MKKFVLCLLSVLIVTYVSSETPPTPDEFFRNRNSSNQVLSTGVPYQFRGEINLIRYRNAHRFYWERVAECVSVANSVTEAAELGQFLLSPNLGDNPDILQRIIELGWMIDVRHCRETNNWVIRWWFPREEQERRTMAIQATHIFAINRSDGSVVEYFDNRGRTPIPWWDYGWQRTLNIPYESPREENELCNSNYGETNSRSSTFLQWLAGLFSRLWRC